MLNRQVFENIDRGRDRLALAILHRLGQPEFGEEHLPKLPRRVDIELLACQSMDFPRPGVALLLQFHRHAAERRSIDLHAGGFHPRKDRSERQVDGVVDVDQPGLVFNFLAQSARQAQRHIGSLNRHS